MSSSREPEVAALLARLGDETSFTETVSVESSAECGYGPEVWTEQVEVTRRVGDAARDGLIALGASAYWLVAAAADVAVAARAEVLDPLAATHAFELAPVAFATDAPAAVRAELPRLVAAMARSWSAPAGVPELVTVGLLALALDPARLADSLARHAVSALHRIRARDPAGFDATVARAHAPGDVARLVAHAFDEQTPLESAAEAIARLVVVPDCGGAGAQLAAVLEPGPEHAGSERRPRLALAALRALVPLLDTAFDRAAGGPPGRAWYPARLRRILAAPAPAHLELVAVYGDEILDALPALDAFGTCPSTLHPAPAQILEMTALCLEHVRAEGPRDLVDAAARCRVARGFWFPKAADLIDALAPLVRARNLRLAADATGIWAALERCIGRSN